MGLNRPTSNTWVRIRRGGLGIFFVMGYVLREAVLEEDLTVFLQPPSLLLVFGPPVRPVHLKKD
jgi:hypothetical protein